MFLLLFVVPFSLKLLPGVTSRGNAGNTVPIVKNLRERMENGVPIVEMSKGTVTLRYNTVVTFFTQV